MTNFDDTYKKLISQSNLIINQNDNETSEDPFKKENQMIQQQSKAAKSNSYDWLSNMILPTLLGLGSTSMLFGQGLFGIGKKNKFFGGWGGQLLGGLGLVATLPGLWSNKSIGQRFTDSFSKFGNGQIWQGLKQLLGISPAADAVLKNGQQQADKNNSKQESIQARRNTYVHNIQNGEQLLKYLKANGYQHLSDLTVFNENISMFLIKPKYDAEIQKYGDKLANGIIITTSKGTRAAMFKPADAVSLLNSKFINYLAAALSAPTKNEDGTYKNDGNPHLKDKPDMQAGLTALRGLISKNAQPTAWLVNATIIADGLRSMNVGGLTCVKQLFAGFAQLPDIAIPLEIKQPDIVKQQQQVSANDIADSFKNDQSLKDMKEDPMLNKFDDKIKNLQNDTKDIYLNTLKQSIQQANQKDPDGYIIEGKIGNKTVYYARKPENNYLTDNIEETVYFSKQTVEKLQGSGTPEIKLQNTLQAVKMPQIMKMKNSGLTLYIKSINIQYMKKVSEILKTKFNISL